jgi:hypothetical protein
MNGVRARRVVYGVKGGRKEAERALDPLYCGKSAHALSCQVLGTVGQGGVYRCRYSGRVELKEQQTAVYRIYGRWMRQSWVEVLKAESEEITY